MPAELCFDPSKVLQQDCLSKESKSLEVATESRMISAERKTSVDFTVHPNISGLMQPDGDYTENGQLSGELREQDKLDCSESSSLCDFDLEQSESFSINSEFVHLIENHDECSEYSAESNASDQTIMEENEPEAFPLFQAMPDRCMYYDQVDAEMQEFDSSDLETLLEYETESEQPSEEDSSDEGSEYIGVSALYEQYSEQDQNAVFELDNEPCESFEQCELNNQNMPCECHTTHFESSEMCQASKESMPAGLSGSLVQQPPAERIENTYDRELTAKNSQGSCTDSFEGSVQSQLSDDFAEQNVEQNQSFEYSTEQDYETECVKTLEQCSSCGQYFEKCEIPEQCEAPEPAQNSEDSQQSEAFDISPELCEAFGTQCSVFHTSDLPRANPPIECNTNDARKRPECDMMFIGSMETFEARWLSQFLAVDCHQNNTLEQQEVEDLDVASGEPSNELLSCDSNAEAVPVIEPLDTSGEQRTLCGECEMRENGQLKYDMPSQLFELCDIKAGTFDLEYDEHKTGESVDKEASIDECSEEEYADCIDGKSQGSTETDESFKSFIDEPEEMCPVQTDDSIPLLDLPEKDECCNGPRQELHEVIEGLVDTPDPYPHDGGEANENAQEFRSEPEIFGKGVYKTYAEVLCSGLSIETVPGPKPCLEHAVPIEKEDYGLKHIDEDTTAHAVPDQDPEVFSEDENIVGSHGETIVLDPPESAGEIYELPAVDESIYERVASDPSSIQSTCREQGISALEMFAEDESITVSEVSEKFTEVSRPAEKEVKCDLVSETAPDKTESANKNEACWSNLTDDAQIKEETGSEVIDETEGDRGPCCGEIETCENVDTFVFDYEEVVGDVEKCNELNVHEEAQHGAHALLIAQNAIELQSDKDPLKDPELSGCCRTSLDLAETTEQKDDSSSPQSKCSEKLDEIIHQVKQGEPTEQSEPDNFFKLADENASSDEIEASEDTEASDDEDYPESCDCEFCVQSIEQVQCFRVPCATVNEVEHNLFVAGNLSNFKA